MRSRHPFHTLIFLMLLAIVLAGNVSFSRAFHTTGYNVYQAPPDHLNLIILVKASKASNDPINNLEGNPKTKLQVIQDAVKSVLTTYSFPSNVSVGVMAYGHKVFRDFDKSCKADNFEEIIPVQPFSESIDLLPFMSISGAGDAPTTVALTEAAQRFPKDSPNALNVILLIADGTDSCGQNPDEEANILAERQQVVVYTIGLSTNNNTDAELLAIANQANGTYEKVPNFLSASQRATDELSGLIIRDLDILLSQISAPPPTSFSTSVGMIVSITPTVKAIEATSTSPILNFTAISPTDTVITTPSSGIPANDPGSSVVVLVLSILGAFVIFVSGLLTWKAKRSKSRSTSSKKINDEKERISNLNKEIEALQSQHVQLRNHVQQLQKKDAQNETIIKRNLPQGPSNDLVGSDPQNKKLTAFLQDISKTYSLIGEDKYISLGLLRDQLSRQYSPSEFNELLGLARQEHPSKIWIDKDARGQTIVKLVL